MPDYDDPKDKGPSHAFYSAHGGGPAKNQRRVGNQFMQTSSGMLPPQKTAPPAVVMRKADGTVAPPLPFTAIPADMAAWAFQPHLPMAAPKMPVQARGGDMDGPSVHEAAAAGVSGSGSALPHAERIQAAFGPAHDISHVRAHVGGAAAAASEAIGAQAYATGHQIAFRDAPDVHTAAHEAAHVVQQQQGVQLSGGVGQAGDVYERHADAVADRVVAGESAAELLATGPPSGPLTSNFVQLIEDQEDSSPPETLDTPGAKLLFSSTLLIRHRLMKSRVFKVGDGGLTVVASARWHSTSDIGKNNDKTYHVSLEKEGLLLDREYGTCTFFAGSPNVQRWNGLPSGEYQLVIWTNNTNPHRYLEGTIQVAEHETQGGMSCTQEPDSVLEILHTALDVAGLIPALGIVPDAINAGIYLIEGDWAMAGISAAAMVPILGQGATVTKLGVKVTKEGVERLGREGLEVALKNSLRNSAKKAVSELSANKIGHIMQTKHAWNKLMPHPSWEKVAPLIEETMAKGYPVPYKGVLSKVLPHKGFQIQVTFVNIKGQVKISDAWIITR